MLAEWASDHRITHSSISGLLRILKTYHPELPKDPRSLLGTIQRTPIKLCANGSYYHFGLAASISKTLAVNSNLVIPECIVEHIGIDGQPLYKSTNDQFWQILSMLAKPSVWEPFVIGLFHGQSKLSYSTWRMGQKVIFPEMDAPLRLDDQFNEMICQEAKRLARHGLMEGYKIQTISN